MTDRMPALYLSHGAPPLADDEVWTAELAAWSTELPKPKAVLVVSAHWESAPLTVGATADGVPLTYDFGGFEQRYYEVTYAAPGAPSSRGRGRALAAAGGPVYQDPKRGLDHGAYVPLVEMFPEADVPVVQVSMPTLDPKGLFELGRALAPLRDDGVLIIGSGFTTHNLREALWHETSGAAPEWGREFDHWAQEVGESGDVDAVLDFLDKAPAGRRAHPRTGHFGAALRRPRCGAARGVDAHSTIDGFWYGL